jgi:hypothetical protein
MALLVILCVLGHLGGALGTTWLIAHLGHLDDEQGGRAVRTFMPLLIWPVCLAYLASYELGLSAEDRRRDRYGEMKEALRVTTIALEKTKLQLAEATKRPPELGAYR